RTGLAGLLLALVPPPAALDSPALRESYRYVHPFKDPPVTECTFTFQRWNDGWFVGSRTERGTTHLNLSARYDAQDRLTGADVSLSVGDSRKAVRVTVKDGKAQVQREGQTAQEFAVPPGVVVTSAPDWTDTWLMCRRYDRAKGGKQSFTGLWVH